MRKFSFGVLFSAILLVLLTGCATTEDSAGVSERPWNAPKSWEHGLPTGVMQQGR